MVTTSEHSPPLSAFHSAYDVVFVDSTGLLNLCADMSVEQFMQLCHEAQLSMQFLDSAAGNVFDSLFMRPVNFVEKFDTLVQ